MNKFFIIIFLFYSGCKLTEIRWFDDVIDTYIYLSKDISIVDSLIVDKSKGLIVSENDHVTIDYVFLELRNQTDSIHVETAGDVVIKRNRKSEFDYEIIKYSFDNNKYFTEEYYVSIRYYYFSSSLNKRDSTNIVCAFASNSIKECSE